MRWRRISRRALLGVMLTAPISACISTGSQRTSTSTPGVHRTITLPTTPPTPSPTPQPDSEPTATPTVTATPSPSPTQTPSATPTASASPTPTPPPYTSPLTGIATSEPPGRPFAVQIDNSPEARPQTNLYRADIVYESPTEAGITRFTAFFESDLPSDIGPVRSVRVAALEVIPAHDGILVYSGASIDMTQALFESEIPAIHAEGNGIQASRRDTQRSAPHNLYVSGPDLLEIATELNIARTNRAPSLTFGGRPSGGRRTAGVAIPFPRDTVDWIYDEDRDVFRRRVNDEPHVDFPRDHQQVSADNVVLIRAPFSWMNFATDAAGELTYGVDITGEGDALVLRQGLYYEGTWSRDETDQPLRMFLRDSGEEITLKPGRTWFAILSEATGEPSLYPPG